MRNLIPISVCLSLCLGACFSADRNLSEALLQLERAKALTGYWSAKYGVKTEWSGSTGRVSGKVRGVKFNGTVRIEAGRVSADIKAGFLAEKLGGKKYVEGKIEDYLNPAHTV